MLHESEFGKLGFTEHKLVDALRAIMTIATIASFSLGKQESQGSVRKESLQWMTSRTFLWEG